MKCNLCPKRCNVDRGLRVGACKSPDQATVCRIGKHFWEEPCISGENGSGTVFFGGCNLACRFCQNADISATGKGIKVDAQTLAKVFLYVRDMGACNVNLVSPSHFSDVIADALEIAKPRLTIPVVYNTNSYETVAALRRLDGLVDVYLPDLKFCDSALSQKFCGAANYFEVATAAISEMKRQQPTCAFEDGLLKKGVLVRYLALPGHIEDGKRILDWIAAFDKNAHVSVMAQYFPPRVDSAYPELNRRLTKREYDNLLQYFFNVGLKNGYMQDVSSATEDFVPSFDLAEAERILAELQ